MNTEVVSSVGVSGSSMPPASAVQAPHNPLRDVQDRRLPRVPEPCALVVFGITGDRARKKLIPAIYDLAHRGLLPANFVLLGFARRDWGDGDFAQLAHDAAREHAHTPWDESVRARSADNIKFVPGDFGDDASFDTLSQALTDLSATHGIHGKAAFYLSIPPTFFETVLRQLERTGMADNDKADGWRRVVVEKPFGHDLASGKQLNSLVDRVFGWWDVYRIDQYLGKEMSDRTCCAPRCAASTTQGSRGRAQLSVRPLREDRAEALHRRQRPLRPRECRRPSSCLT